MASKVPDTKDTITFMLDTQQITYTVDMSRDTIQLPVETPKKPFVAPTNIHTIEAFMNRVGYQGVVDKVSAFYKKNLAQPWQTMFKLFNRCLTTRTSGHDQTKINILQLFHVVFNQTHVDYAALLWHEEDYHSIKDDVSLVSVYITGNVLVRGMLILDAFLTAEIREKDVFKEYETVFMKVDVPMNQPQLVVSTQGTHRITPSAHRSPTVSASPPKSKKRKQITGESSLPRKSLKITITQKQLVEMDDDDSEDRIEPESHKDNPEVFDDDDHKEREKQDDEMGSLEEALRHDDAPLEGEKRVKRSKESKRSKSVKGSSSKHLRKDSTTYVSKQQSQKQEWDAWEEDNVIDEDEDSWHKRVYKQNQKKVKKNSEDYYSNHKITEVVRIVTDQPHGLDFMEQNLVMRANDNPDSFSEADFKSCVIWERAHDLELGIECYQMKVNLTAPTLTFPAAPKLNAVVVRKFYKKFYNSLGRVPNRCSSIGKTKGLLSFSRGIDDSRSLLSQLRPDAVTKSLTPSLDGSQRRRFIPTTPSPRSVSNTSSRIWCRKGTVLVNMLLCCEPDTTYGLHPIRCILDESALVVEIDFTWSFGFGSIEPVRPLIPLSSASVEARIFLIIFEFSSFLFVDSAMNMYSAISWMAIFASAAVLVGMTPLELRICLNTSYCLEEQIRCLDCRDQYVVLSGRVDTSYPTGGYGVLVSFGRIRDAFSVCDLRYRFTHSREDDDDEEEDKEEDKDEEEDHPAPADSIEVARLLSIPTLPPSPFSPLSSPLPQILSPPLPISPPPLPASPTHSLGYRASMIRLRAESPSTSYPLPSSTPPSRTLPFLHIPLPTSSPPLILSFTSHREDVPEVTLPPRKRSCIALGLRFKVDESSSAPTARPTGGFRADYGFVFTLDDEIRRDSKRETEIARLRAADRSRQTQLVEALTLLKIMQTQMAALQRQQGLTSGPAHPDVPKEAGSGS
nr:hypothetical protein [Tanacetum cinerariifolium]